MTVRMHVVEGFETIFFKKN